MENYNQYMLFEKIEQKDLESIFNCLQAKKKIYQKDEIIQRAGEKIQKIGLILSGKVKISRDDFYGNSSLLDEIGEGNIFGEVFLCMEIQESPVTVVAVNNCEILFLNFNQMLFTCNHQCPFHTQLIKNMLKIIAQKTLIQNLKIDILSKRGIREKIQTYLFYEMKKAKTNTFEIPFNRKKLAEFLYVDRSALSNELSKMQKEGFIIFKKNKFKILIQE